MTPAVDQHIGCVCRRHIRDRVRRPRGEQRPGAAGRKLVVDPLVDRKRPAAVRDVRVPVQPRLAIVPVPVVVHLVRPPGVVNHRRVNGWGRYGQRVAQPPVVAGTGLAGRVVVRVNRGGSLRSHMSAGPYGPSGRHESRRDREPSQARRAGIVAHGRTHGNCYRDTVVPDLRVARRDDVVRRQVHVDHVAVAGQRLRPVVLDAV